MQRDDFGVKSFPGIAAMGVSEAQGRLRVAIVTEEIIGPVRNGGIASTYYHLAKGLAARGHDVHVLFLKGAVVQDETPEFWARKYAEFGVTLHYLNIPAAPVWSAAPVWQRRYASAYEWLRDQEPFDVVHTSEWRGGLVYALMAKRLGLAFRDTLFLVKTSSPYIWNRHYQMQPITQGDLVAASYAEQKCVELADVVIGGSAHLISFMERIGYRVPDTNVYVQPNIVDFSNVSVVDRRPGRRREHGDVVQSRHLVFFGRLEARKGLELFCGAMDLLHERGQSPDSVTFLGKWGAGLPAQGGMSPKDYIALKARSWQCPIQLVTDQDQAGALSYMCEKDVIAVMPSLIENSTMAVYETLELRIPFIATAVGGTPELISEADHEAVLVPPTAQALADRLDLALREGQVIATPRFHNDENLHTWYGFHAHVGRMIDEHGRREAIAMLSEGADPTAIPVRTVSFCALVRRGESLDDLIKALHGEAPDDVLLAFRDTDVRDEIEEARRSLDGSPIDLTVVSCIGMTAGEAFNELATRQPCDAMVIANGVGVLPQSGFFDAVRHGLSHQPHSLFTTFFATDEVTIGMPLGGDVATQALTSRAYGPELAVLRREAFSSIGDFEPYDAQDGIIHEYMTRASESGHDLLVFPEPLLSWPSAEVEARRFHAQPTYTYLKAKALIDKSELGQRKFLLAALHRARGGSAGVAEAFLRGPEKEETDSQWLVPATWDARGAGEALHRKLIVGLDAEHDEISLYACGRGERRLQVRGEPTPVEPTFSHGTEDSDTFVTLSTFRVPASWESGSSYPLVWGLYDGEEKLRNLMLRISKIGDKTFVMSSRKPVLSHAALADLLDRQLASWSQPPEDGDLTVDDVDPTERFVDQAVAGARQFVERREATDPERINARSRALLSSPPASTPIPINVGSGIKPPEGRNGWCAGDWLRGWAWDREERERILHVALKNGRDTLLLVVADVVDPRLDIRVPGRGSHAFSIPILREYLDMDELHLEILEGPTVPYRGRFYVDRSGRPMLRRPHPTPDLGNPPATLLQRARRRLGRRR